MPRTPRSESHRGNQRSSTRAGKPYQKHRNPNAALHQPRLRPNLAGRDYLSTLGYRHENTDGRPGNSVSVETAANRPYRAKPDARHAQIITG